MNRWEGEGNISFYPQFNNTDSLDYSIAPNSPMIDKGIAYFSYNDTILVDMDESEYLGSSPDIGYSEVEGEPEPVITFFEQVPIVSEINATTGCNWIDYDSDGDLDLFVTNFAQSNSLYTNDGKGVFIKLDFGNIVTDVEKSVGATWGDYDNDGNIDVYVVNDKQKNSFYRNLGNGFFDKILQNNEITHDSITACASWSDYNNDGNLDLFIGMGVDAITTQLPLVHKLFVNNGNDNFTEQIITNTSSSANTENCIWADFQNDGFADLVIGNATYPWGGEVKLVNNFGNGSFSYGNISGNKINYSLSAGDFNNDGYLDLFLADNYYMSPEPAMYGATNRLLINNTRGGFIPITDQGIVTQRAYSSGSALCDFDNDGDLDIFVANGVRGSNTSNFLYRNDGNNLFTKVISKEEFGNIIANYGKSNSCAWGDFDNDGDLDLYVTSREGVNSLYKNNATEITNNKWIRFTCIGNETNKSAIGTKIRIKATIFGKEVWQMREISSQTGRSSQNSLDVEFGLGDATKIDVVIVDWVSGVKDSLYNMNTNQFIELNEGNGFTDTSERTVPLKFQLSQNYPNPFNPTTVIKYSIPVETRRGVLPHVTLKIYDILGKELATLVNKEQSAGSYKVEFQAINLSSGVYFYKLQAGSFVETKKMLLLR